MSRLIASAMTDLMPRAHGLPGVADTDLHGFLAKLRREADPLFVLGLVVGALLYHFTPLLTVHWPLPAFWLPRRVRDRHAQRLVATNLYPLRQMVYLVKLCAGMCWGMDPVVRERFALQPYAADPGTFRT